jgi:hypothetical protein
VPIDLSKYNGSLSFIFQASGRSTAPYTQSAYLYGSVDGLLATATVSTGYSLQEDSFSSMTSSQYVYYTRDTYFESYSVKLIIIQDTGSNPLTATRCYYPIGIYYMNTSETLVVNTFLMWYYDSSFFVATTKNFYITVSWKGTSDKYTSTIYLYHSTSSTSTGSSVMMVVNAASSTQTFSTPAAFTPNNGYFHKLAGMTSNNGKNTLYLLGGQVIVDLSDPTRIEKFVELYNCYPGFATNGAGTTYSGLKTLYDANQWTGAAPIFYPCVQGTYHATSGDGAELLADSDSSVLENSPLVIPSTSYYYIRSTTPITAFVDDETYSIKSLTDIP